MISKATLRFLRTSPQKARLVVDQIRGRSVEDALALLKASPKRVARHVEKVLASALANAEQREERVDVDRLFVSGAFVDQGPRERRGKAGAMGRFMPRIRRRSHLTVQLDVKEKA